MRYQTKEKKIELAALNVRNAAVRIGNAQAKLDKAEAEVYEAKNEHNRQLKAYRLVVEKIAKDDALIEGRMQGRRQLVEEQARKAKAVK